MKRKKLNSIQGMRGLAALAVVLTHNSYFIDLPDSNFLKIFLSNGSWGVDLFFIISGFVSAYTIPISIGGLSNGVNYFIKRLIRIVPLYYFLTFVSCGTDYGTLMTSLRSIFFIPAGYYINTGIVEGPIYGGARIGQGWTLNYEMYFYAIVALSFIFNSKKWIFTTLFITCTVILPLVFLPIPPNYISAGFLFKSMYISMVTNPITLEFIAGVMLGLLYDKIETNFSTFNIVLCIFSIVLFLINITSSKFSDHGILGWGWGSLLLVYALVKLEKCELSQPKVLLFLGEISYSLYLIHFNILNIIYKIFSRTSKGVNGHKSLILFLSITMSLIAAKYLHRFFEVRMSIFLKRKWQQSIFHFKDS